MRLCRILCLMASFWAAAGSEGVLLAQETPPLPDKTTEAREQPETNQQAEESWYQSLWAWALVPLALLVLFLLWFVPLSTSPETDPSKSPKK